MKFKDKLLQAAKANRSWLCVGLDPDPAKLPDHIEKSIAGIEQFLTGIIDATTDLVCAYKPNAAFYEQFGEAGIGLLKKIIDYIPESIPVILDAKRGDIGNTSRMYAVAAFDDLGADAVTVNPYMGYDCIMPFLDYGDKGVIILCLTSNPSAADFQKVMAITEKGETPIYEIVARKAIDWNVNDNIGLVVGATKPEELASIRGIIGEGMPILVPGVGAQGGDLEASIKAGSNSEGKLAIINVSRSVLYASTATDYADKSRQAAENLASQMRKLAK